MKALHDVRRHFVFAGKTLTKIDNIGAENINLGHVLQDDCTSGGAAAGGEKAEVT